jgi:opacity protein-like surface antigen
MRVLGASTIAALLFTAAAAQAQTQYGSTAANASPMYGELGYTWAKVSGDGGSAKPGLLRGIIGYNFHPNLAVEGMAAVGIKDDSRNIGGVDVNAKVQHSLGIYLKPKFNVTPALEVFGRAGYASTQVKLDSALGSSSTRQGDWSYGAGLTYSFGRATYAGLDYMRYADKDGVKVDGVTLSVGYRF